MFLGHYAVGIASKKLAPSISLGVLILGCQFLDLIWPLFVLAGLERVAVDVNATKFTPIDFSYYPYSHSLVMSLAWAFLVMSVYYYFRRNKKESVVVGSLVLSHWILDVVAHRPDMPLGFDNQFRVGLGLWNSVTLTVTLETVMFVIGVGLFLSSTAKKQGWGFWSLIGSLVLISLGNAFGPKPPPEATPAMIAGPALAMWIFVAWGWWIDRLPKQKPGVG